MESLVNIACFFYLLSTVAYLTYLFRQKEVWCQTGLFVLMAGFVPHSVQIVYRMIQTGHMPVRNLHETLIIAGWMVAGVFLLFQYKYQLKILGLYVAPLLSLVMIAASQFPAVPLEAQRILNNFWLVAHIVTIFMGDAAFALACGLGVFYLIQERSIKSKVRGFFFKRLPPLERIDSTGYACIIVGFTLLTIGLATGFVYAKSVWGRFWSWDPKEIWSGITWLLYAALLHGRISLGWRGRKAAIMAIIGFVVLLFTFLGVNFLLTGHHGQFTRV